jgi:hypothetical protein
VRAAGYGTYFVTDNLHQYKASMNYHRGFDSFDFIRGQTSDHFKPSWTYPPERFESALINGTGELENSLRQYFANVQFRQTEEDWFAPQVFSRASEVLETVSAGGPFFLTLTATTRTSPGTPPKSTSPSTTNPTAARSLTGCSPVRTITSTTGSCSDEGQVLG